MIEIQEPYAYALKRIDDTLQTGAQILDLRGVGLSELPPEIGNLSNLRELYLDGNQLAVLPEEISRLHNLIRLQVSQNYLVCLPDSLWSLKKLEKLYLDFNQLKEISDQIVALERLSSLGLSHNQLTVLPDNLGLLRRLDKLILENNRLTNLPESLLLLAQTRTLKLLFLHENPDLPIPPYILGATWTSVRHGNPPADPFDILVTYFQRRVLATPDLLEPMNEAKVIIVGEGAVGKSTLVMRILGLPGNAPDKTSGISILPFSYLDDKNRHIRVNFWDFGGQEIMHATHQCFLTKRTVYLLVLNARVDPEVSRMSYWLRIIRSFGGDDAPVLVVINFSDQHELLLDQHTYRRKFPNIRKFLYTSATAANPEGIEELKDAIKHEVDTLEHVRGDIPLKWKEVKTELEALRDKKAYNYLSWSQYAGICSTYGVRDQDEQGVLVDFLHALGTVLNFRGQNEELEDTNVLNPIWVTRGIYLILNSPAHEKGHIRRSELNKVLPGDWYPDARSRQFIVDVMVQFELCYKVPRRNNRGPIQYIIPDLLNPERPDNLSWDPVAPLRFQYDFDVLPQAIVSRFIVRAKDRPTTAYWRDGIQFRIEDNECLFVADRNENKIYIEVSGVDAERRRALKVIRDEIERIVYSVKDLELQARVPLPDESKLTVGYSHLLKLEKAGQDRFFPEGASRFYSVSELLEGVTTVEERGSDRWKEITTAQQVIWSESDYKLAQFPTIVIVRNEAQNAIRNIEGEEGTIRQFFKSALRDLLDEIEIAHRRGADRDRIEEILNIVQEVATKVKANEPLPAPKKKSVLAMASSVLKDIETVTRIPEIGDKLGKLAATVSALLRAL